LLRKLSGTSASRGLTALLEQAEANAVEGKRCTKSELHENEDRLLAQTSLVKQRDAELVDMQSKA